KAEILMRDAGMVPERPATVQDVQKMHSMLQQKHQLGLIVYDRRALDAVIFQGDPPDPPKNRIALVLDSQHYNLIINEQSYFSKQKLCFECGAFYRKTHT